jgi:hypothetical protein
MVDGPRIPRSAVAGQLSRIPPERHSERLEEHLRGHAVGSRDVPHAHPAGDLGDVRLTRDGRGPIESVAQPPGCPAADHQGQDEPRREHGDEQWTADAGDRHVNLQGPPVADG